MSAFRWGIIGPGNIAHSFGEDLRLVEGEHQIISVLGRSKESLDQFCSEFGARLTFTDLDEFVEKSNIDAVYIATPHPQHLEQALACLKHRIPVLCEKPITLNAQQSKELLAAAHKQNTFLMDGMWIRFLPSIRKVLELVGSNVIGEIKSIKASMAYDAPEDENSRYYDPELGGGSLLDLGIYPIFLSYLLLGRPQRINASGVLTSEGVDEQCNMTFHYQGRQFAILSSSLKSNTNPPAEITGELGTIRILNPWFEKSKGIELEVAGKEPVVFPCEWDGHGLQFEIKEVVDCIRAGKIESDTLSHAFTQDVMEIMDEVRRQINVTYPVPEEA